MATILIRKIDDSTFRKISELASKKNMSREAYVRSVLRNHALDGELRELDRKYNTLVLKLMDQQNMLSDLMERVLEVIQNEKNI